MSSNIYKWIIIVWIFCGCGSSKNFMKYQYKFSDSSSRNILIKFRPDSTFLLLNSVSGNLSYSFVGRWKKLDDGMLVLTNPRIDTLNLKIVDNAPGPGEKIDTRMASENRSYIFPIITSDSITFTNKRKSFLLKGFEFKRGSSIKE